MVTSKPNSFHTFPDSMLECLSEVSSAEDVRVAKGWPSSSPPLAMDTYPFTDDFPSSHREPSY